MTTIYLHIGTHKTGTTSLQKWSNQNRELLLKNGINYPNPCDIGLKNYFAHHEIALNIKKNWFQPLPLPQKARDLFDNTNTKKILLSAEPFYRTPVPNSVKDRTNWEKKYEYILKCKKMFDQYDCKVVITLRNHVDFIESLYKEHILATSYTGSIEEFSADKSHLFDYSKNINIWESIFGKENIIIIKYSPNLSIKKFYSAIGIQLDHEIHSTANTSLSPYLIEIKRKLNVKCNNNNRYRSILKAVNDYFIWKKSNIINESFAKKIDSRYKLDTANLQSRGIDITKRKTRPKKSKSNYLTLNKFSITVIKFIFDTAIEYRMKTKKC